MCSKKQEPIVDPTFRRCTQKCHLFSQYGSRSKTEFTFDEIIGQIDK